MSPLPERWRQVLREAARIKGDADALTRWAYERHFARWTAPATAAAATLAGQPAFVEAVALSVSSAWTWEHGWEVLEHAGKSRFVHNGHMRLFLESAAELHPRRAPVGAKAAVLMPCLREGLMPGFLYAFSREGMIDPAAPHVRMYLNVTAPRAAALMKALLTDPSFAALRFEAKMPNDPAAYNRCDSMLVYVEPPHARATLDAILAWRGRHPQGWARQTPFAALEVAPGVALAESPPMVEGEARSMGLHRCGLIAQAVLDARRSRREDAEAKLLKLLEREGIDPAMPHGQRLPAQLWKTLTLRRSRTRSGTRRPATSR